MSDQYSSPKVQTLQGSEILERFGPVSGGSFAQTGILPEPRPGGIVTKKR